MTRRLSNLVAFQLGWLACVIGAARGYAVVGTLVAAVLVAMHLAIAPEPRRELRLVGLALGLGFVFDGALAASDWVRYAGTPATAYLAPHWILAMWALFATTLTGCLGWLRRSRSIAVALGAVGGPASYLAGAGLGGVELLEPAHALTALAVGWAIALPLLVHAARDEAGLPTRSLTTERC